MKKVAAFATTTVLLVAAGTGAASAREARPGDHRGADDGTVRVVEAPTAEAPEAPEVDAAAVEAPETEAAEVDAAAVEAPETEAP